jgi:beta-N-acetylhexosaminidase
MPSALAQGRMTSSALHAASRRWGHQLLAAGVQVDLAPVADTVPAAGAASNQPIGQYDREYGHQPGRVATHAVAFLRGMRDAGVTATVKHFPGLGRASGNTDTTSHVTDPTTRHDPYLRPFRHAVEARARMVMVSSATYPHIDRRRPACFSSAVITGLLRGGLGFSGVVVSDDLGVPALDYKPVAARALGFLRAGGTIVLDTSPAQVATMARAVRHRMRAHPHFATVVRADTMLVLQAKAHAGLVPAA